MAAGFVCLWLFLFGESAFNVTCHWIVVAWVVGGIDYHSGISRIHIDSDVIIKVSYLIHKVAQFLQGG